MILKELPKDQLKELFSNQYKNIIVHLEKKPSAKLNGNLILENDYQIVYNVQNNLIDKSLVTIETNPENSASKIITIPISYDKFKYLTFYTFKHLGASNSISDIKVNTITNGTTYNWQYSWDQNGTISNHFGLQGLQIRSLDYYPNTYAKMILPDELINATNTGDTLLLTFTINPNTISNMTTFYNDFKDNMVINGIQANNTSLINNYHNFCVYVDNFGCIDPRKTLYADSKDICYCYIEETSNSMEYKEYYYVYDSTNNILIPKNNIFSLNYYDLVYYHNQILSYNNNKCELQYFKIVDQPLKTCLIKQFYYNTLFTTNLLNS